MDELSPLFQEIEFHERYRGYDPDEVDAFVDRVARAAAAMRGRITELHERVEAAEARGGGAVVHTEAEETLTRTLVLAQRTADAAIAEAREEADRVTADAATSAQAILSNAEAEAQLTLRESQAEGSATLKDAEDRAGLLLAEAETDRRLMVAQAESVASEAAGAERERLSAEVAELHEYRAFLADDIEILERHLTEERNQLTSSVSALTDLLESPEAFRASRAPATSGLELGDDVIEALATFEAPVMVEEIMVEEVTVEETPIADDFAAEVLIADQVDEIADQVDEIADPVDEIADPVDEPETMLESADEAMEFAPEFDPQTETAREPAFESEGSDTTIDLVAAEAEAEAEADPTDDGSDLVDETVFYSGIDLADPISDQDPMPVAEVTPPTEPPMVGEPAFAGMTESSLADAPTVDPAPQRLVTAADLETAAPSGGRLGFESSTFEDPFDDGGPATQAVPALQDGSLFAEPDTADDPFLAQLRDAMEGEVRPQTDDDALSAFFDQEDDDGGRSWFGRRR